jgi:hypothetical protein
VVVNRLRILDFGVWVESRIGLLLGAERGDAGDGHDDEFVSILHERLELALGGGNEI